MENIIQKTKKQIKDLKIQGATNIAKASILAIYQYAQKERFKDAKDFHRKILKAAKGLAFVRPTEPLAQNAMRFLLSEIKGEKELEKEKNKLLNTCGEILKILEAVEEKIAKYTSNIIENGDKILTHCHSSTVEKGLIFAKNEGKAFEVYNTETRPLFQGRITAKNLIKASIPTTMVVDSSAGFLISKYSGKELIMNKVLIGCDAILKDGSIINKIGSFGISLSAYYEKVPLYVATSLLKFTPKSWIKIERRSPREIWKNAPKGLKIINFAFDVVPAKFIKGIICEKGLIKPSQIKTAIKETYPWIFTNTHILQ